MNNKSQFCQLVEEVDFRLAHRRDLRERGVHLIVTHSCHIPGTLCAPGERIEDIALAGQPESFSLGLSPTSLLLMDCLCRYRRPLTAQRIEQIMTTHPFYVQYAANGRARDQPAARPDRKTIRVYVPRIWSQMEKAFRCFGLSFNPEQILLVEDTDSNLLMYRLRATFEVLHIDCAPSLKSKTSRRCTSDRTVIERHNSGRRPLLSSRNAEG